MPCYHPITGWRHRLNGGITFNPKNAYIDLPQTVSCGYCIGCKLKRARTWAIRAMHEASLHTRNCFITLTYSDKHLPEYSSLRLADFQLFMKRLRRKFGENIRYLHCGEYGEKYGRPHYHALLFNLDFSDRIPFKKKNGHIQYVSDTLTERWGLGHAVVGDLTYESAAYVSRYTTKKNLRDYRLVGNSETPTRRELPRREKINLLRDLSMNGHTPQIVKEQEYITMSRRPGLGRGWLEKFKNDVYPDDFVLKGNQKFQPPRYYDHVFELDNPEQFDKIKNARKQKAKQNACETTPERLAVKERLQYKRLEYLKRDLTHDT